MFDAPNAAIRFDILQITHAENFKVNIITQKKLFAFKVIFSFFF